ncbi:hypothetical protein Asi03nite_22960 [Actinoplanes siamensis]|uniref:Uncharacterized protein n=2 Tax=Actinoplanes siamensis TaxID=1223317 RepID=A0A919N5I2_9ACTN|nr:hypothetical protein Asi03nite_22960 [Actinoplanes siamensis]
MAAALVGCAQQAHRGDPEPSGPMETPPSGPTASQPTAQTTDGDHGWFETNGELTGGFCLTWIAGTAPGQVMQKLGGRRLGTTGWGPDWASFSGRRRGEAVMAVAAMSGWSLVVEDNGILGLRDDLLERLSTRTTVVSHYRNVEQDSRFALVKNGDIQVAFDPYDPGDRTGSHPDMLLAAMRAAGFATDGQGSDDADATELAFALTERLTRVPMTTALLHAATYIVTAVYDADTAAWEQENPDPGLQPAG